MPSDPYRALHEALLGEQPAFLEDIDPDTIELPTRIKLGRTSPEQMQAARAWIAELDAQLVRPQPPLADGEPLEY